MAGQHVNATSGTLTALQMQMIRSIMQGGQQGGAGGACLGALHLENLASKFFPRKNKALPAAQGKHAGCALASSPVAQGMLPRCGRPVAAQM